MHRISAAAAVVCAGVLVGCGRSAATPSGTGAGASARPVSGATVFAHECSYCHSLIGNESLHREGGDLLGYTLTRQQLLLQTRQMPVRHQLSAAQLNAV